MDRDLIVLSLVRLIRYRFFLFAGLLPYFLGQAVAFNRLGTFSQLFFWWGLAGVLLVLVAVELFNEYFDFKVGGDRIFAEDQPDIPNWFHPLGLAAVVLAFAIGIYLTVQTGWPVLVFCFFGFLGAYFYVGPPVRWAYRGFGETTIALCYGPFMVLGSYYIQAKVVDFVPFFVSLISGLSVFCLAVLNEIPDYYQDMLVGKKNLVVRLGKQKAFTLLKLVLAGVFVILTLGILFKIVPVMAAGAFITLPWIWKSLKNAGKDLDDPKVFRFAVNTLVITHIVIAVLLGVSFLKG